MIYEVSNIWNYGLWTSKYGIFLYTTKILEKFKHKTIAKKLKLVPILERKFPKFFKNIIRIVFSLVTNLKIGQNREFNKK